MISSIKKLLSRLKFTESNDYWDKRYLAGGNSGIGSYGRLAAFKAEVINQIIDEYAVSSAIEFGCGDGNQLEQFHFSRYIGLDVSPSAIGRCAQKFNDHKNRSFLLYQGAAFADNAGVLRSEVSMSLDVIYHLVEDSVFETYMRHLFQSASMLVLIYSSNKNGSFTSAHVRERKFTDWIDVNQPDWRLIKHIPNRFPPGFDENPEVSFADFYLFAKAV